MASACDEYISYAEVISESPVSPSPLDICTASHRSNYHHQQTINNSLVVTEMCIDNFSADQTSKSVHEHDNHTGDYETLFKQVPPCSINAQSLNTVHVMCLKYNANDPPNINSVNTSGMLVSQNLPGG